MATENPNSLSSEGKWDTLSSEVKEGSMYRLLVQLDLKYADPDFYESYQEALLQTTDASDKMKYDIQMFNRVKQLRQERKMLPIEPLRAKAKAMIDLNPEAMKEAFTDFVHELKNAKLIYNSLY